MRSLKTPTSNHLHPKTIQSKRYNEGFWRLDKDGRLLEVNPAYMIFSGYSEQELLGMRVTNLQSQESLEDPIRKLFQPGTTFETRHKRKDGSEWEVEITTAFIEQDDNYAVVFLHDISERKQAEQLLNSATLTERHQIKKELDSASYKLQENQLELEMQNQALQQSRDRYVDLFDFAPIGYLSLTAHGKITEINLTGAKLLGIDRQQALNRHIGYFLAAEECDHWHSHNTRTLKQHDRQSGEFCLRREDNTVFYAQMDCQRRDNWTSTLVHVSFTDITERKQLEQQLRQAQKMEALGQLTGGIAHDFNNILAVILGYANLARERCVDDASSKSVRYLGEVIAASERGRDLIAKILAYSRTSLVVASEPLDISQEVGKVADMLAAVIPIDIKMTTHIEPTVRPVRIDPVDVQQVLVNLVINARDAIGEHGRIDITLKQLKINNASCAICHKSINGDYVSLEVKDNGIGIPASIIPRIFDPFFTTKEIGKGSGLGLSMVQGVVKKNNGHLLVKTGPDLGTCFQLLLPSSNKETSRWDEAKD